MPDQELLPTPLVNPRRHDLDALRACAMLLGIGLHAGLSFFPLPWPVQDTNQSEMFGLPFAAIHGFRMPLFFVLSGFFTAMLWRRRGLWSLLWHRFRRIFLPLVLGLVTIIPAVNWVAMKAMESGRANVVRSSEGTARVKQSNETVELEMVDLLLPRYVIKAIAGGDLEALIRTPVVHHLWFLWFLCWLVAGFAVYAVIADRLAWRGLPKWLVLSPLRYLWLIPLTLIPASFMVEGFGPDTSAGILPMPHVMFYYAIFFGFGVLFYDCDDQTGRVGRWWWMTLPVALLVVFPIGLSLTFRLGGLRELVDPDMQRPVGILLQVMYAWMMTFALMGLFRKLLRRESKTMRYLSDSAYWLYLAHVPLVIGLQWMVRDWPQSASVKFVFVCAVVTGFLLLTYQTLVRYTWLGRLLNGPRKRPQPAEEPVAVEA